MIRIKEVLENKGDNYIMPFLWLHGESHDILEEEIEKIYQCGIGEICLESRPHPDFMGPQWWSDLDFIMDQARRRNMRIWILDDDKFPTGHANGAYKTQADKKKIYLAERHMDLLGPLEDGAVLIENFLGREGQLLRALICKRTDGNSLDLSLEGVIDVTESYREGMVFFELPKGFHRLIVLYTTRENGGREDYINLIDRDSVKVLIDEVYESHYERYKKDFGKTFAGFFSDEPELGNVPGYDFHELIGKKDRHLPWSDELFCGLQEAWKEDTFKNLLGLWYQVGNQTKSIRRTYMDQVTGLVDTCFTSQIGDWCRARQVEYIGHIIEDDNAHTRLGCSVGHYFRAQKGQDMAGIDLVHLQLIPGFKEVYHQWIASDRDGEFFHFGLAKLATSLARLDPPKKGRSLCELFGSYGWAEGIGLMKWLTDHMLIRGVNHFIPHAFSPLFPDRDCPPHFYGRGNNPQYPYFVSLMKHMNRMAHLISGGHLDAGMGVLYHAEAEWSGGEYEPYQKIVRSLAEIQVESTIIPLDYLSPDKVSFTKGSFTINQLEYKCLFIPYCRYIADEVVDFVERAREWAIPIYMTGAYPQESIGGRTLPETWYEGVELTRKEDIPNLVNDLGQREIMVMSQEADLRASTIYMPDGRIYMFFNEHPFDRIDTDVILKSAKGKKIFRYDSVNNTIDKGNFQDSSLSLHLAPGELAVYFCDDDLEADYHEDDLELSLMDLKVKVQLKGDWNISTLETGVSQDFAPFALIRSQDELPNINRCDKMARFSGIIRYESHIPMTSSLHTKGHGRTFLDLPGISEPATIRINGLEVGQVLSAPYHIEITGFLKEGINTISIDVINNLTWRLHDGQSTHINLRPSGMIKRPMIHVYEKSKEV